MVDPLRSGEPLPVRHTDTLTPAAGNPADDAPAQEGGGASICLDAYTVAICKEVEMGMTQGSIAVTYASAIRAEALGSARPNWRAINRAILSRWKTSGLERIKKRAWDLFSGKVKP